MDVHGIMIGCFLCREVTCPTEVLEKHHWCHMLVLGVGPVAHRHSKATDSGGTRCCSWGGHSPVEDGKGVPPITGFLCGQLMPAVDSGEALCGTPI